MNKPSSSIPPGCKAKSKGKGKSSSYRESPDTHCEHPESKLTTRGSNQYKDKLRCLQCGMLLVDTDTPWWRQEKEYREHEKALKAEKEREVKAEMKKKRLQDMYKKMTEEEDGPSPQGPRGSSSAGRD